MLRKKVGAIITTLSMSAGAETLSVNVTHASATYDVRAVGPDGTAYALNLGRSSAEIWASSDGARNWSLRGKSAYGGFKQMTALASGVLLADTQTSAGFTLVRSTDRGATWAPVLNLGRYRLLTPHSIDAHDGTVFLLEYQDFSNDNTPIRLWASADQGASWSVRQQFSFTRHGHGVRIAPDGAVWVFLGDRESQTAILRSTNEGWSFAPVLSGQQARVVDGLFVGADLLFGQDIPDTPLYPHAARLTPSGTLTQLLQLPGPSYSIHRAAGGGYLLGTTREPTGSVYAPGDISAHLLGSVDGTSWQQAGYYPRVSSSDYARADVYWLLPSGEAVLNLRNVQTISPGGRGFQLLKTTITGDDGTTHFRADFTECPFPARPGAGWTIAGTWQCSNGVTTAAGMEAQALAATDMWNETDASALVRPEGAEGAGLLVRVNGADAYAGRMTSGGQAQLVRHTSGGDMILSSVAAPYRPGEARRIRLHVTGQTPATLALWIDGTPAGTATDPKPLSAGRAGLWHTGGGTTVYDDVTLRGFAGSSPPPPPPATSFADNFNDCTSATGLGPEWTVQGRWYCRAERARGEGASALALVRTSLPADLSVQALVQLNGDANGSGVVARASGGRYYLARIRREGRVELVRIDNGSEHILGSVSRTIRRDTSYIVGLQVEGALPVRLAVRINGSETLTATDDTDNRLSSGAAGLLAAGPSTGFVRTQFDDFRTGP